MTVHISSPWIKLGLFVFCGVLASWLTTWPQAWSNPSAENITLHRAQAADSGGMSWSWEDTPKPMSRVLTGFVVGSGTPSLGEVSEPPPWTRFSQARSETDPASISYLASGWPVECFRSTSIPEAMTAGSVRFRWEIFGGIPVGPRESFAISLPPRNIPVVPLWPGLLLSTLAWSVAAFVIVYSYQHAVRAVRSYSRRKQGLCSGCSYPLRDLTLCPECGESNGSASPKLAHAAAASHG